MVVGVALGLEGLQVALGLGGLVGGAVVAALDLQAGVGGGEQVELAADLQTLQLAPLVLDQGGDLQALGIGIDVG